MRRRLLAGLVSGLVLLTSAACTTATDRPDAQPESSSPTPSPSPSPSATSTPTGAPVTLRFAVYGDRESLASYRALAKAFTAQHPNVTVAVDASSSAAVADARLDSRFTAGTSPDVFLTDASRLPTLMAKGRVQPVDQLLEKRGVQFGDNYQRIGLEAFAADAALQCMPNDVSPYVVFYNKRLLDTSLLPSRTDSVPMPQDNGWSWNQFTVAAAQMSRGAVKGVYLPPKLTTLTPLMRSAGSDVVDDPKNPTTLTLSPTSNRNDL